jgi:hypothetical protein
MLTNSGRSLQNPLLFFLTLTQPEDFHDNFSHQDPFSRLLGAFHRFTIQRSGRHRILKTELGGLFESGFGRSQERAQMTSLGLFESYLCMKQSWLSY